MRLLVVGGKLQGTEAVYLAAKAGHAIQSDDPWAVVAAVSRALARQHTVTLAGEGSNLQPSVPKCGRNIAEICHRPPKPQKQHCFRGFFLLLAG